MSAETSKTEDAGDSAKMLHTWQSCRLPIPILGGFQMLDQVGPCWTVNGRRLETIWTGVLLYRGLSVAVEGPSSRESMSDRLE